MGFSSKDEQGRIIQLNENAEADYLTFNNPVESIKFEEKTLRNFIYKVTNTAEMSEEERRGISNISGIALKIQLFDPYSKALRDKLEVEPEMSYRIDLIGDIQIRMGNASETDVEEVDIQPEIIIYMPESDTEVITNINNSLVSGSISLLTACTRHPYVDNPDLEVELIRQDKQMSMEMNLEFQEARAQQAIEGQQNGQQNADNSN